MFEHISYKESTLANGLKVLTASSNAIPVVDAQVWTRTGYRYEQPSELGYAHLLEHMLFGGTKKRPTKYDLLLEIDRRGGHINAMTSQELVVYESQMLKDDAELMVDILSDMLFGSLLDKERLETEKGVVLQELKQKQEDHAAYFTRWSQKKLLPEHPLSHNILDTEETTHAATPKSLRAYLERHYRPDQSAFVMSGDISHEEALRLGEKYFGHWKNPAEPFDKRLVPMKRPPENYFYEKRDIKQTFLALAYFTPPLGDLRVSAAWALLSDFLTGGMTSVLVQEVREKRGLVYGIRSSWTASWDTGMFMINAGTQKPKEVRDTVERIVAEIPERLTDAVVENSRSGAIGLYTRRLVKPGVQAGELGSDFITYNRLFTPDEWIGHLRAVTKDDILTLVHEYLKPENSVLVTLGGEDIGR
jgi:predicted Zn-dependent peptidase